MKKSPRPKLVFWLWTFVGIVTQFLTIIALDLTSVAERLVRAFFFLFLMGLPDLNCVYSASRGRTFSTLSISLALLLLLLLPRYLGRLRTLRTWLCFCTLDLGFFRPGVLHGTALTLGDGGVAWSVAPGTVLIYFFGTRARPESRLGLSVNSFLDHLIEAF